MTPLEKPWHLSLDDVDGAEELGLSVAYELVAYDPHHWRHVPFASGDNDYDWYYHEVQLKALTPEAKAFAKEEA